MNAPPVDNPNPRNSLLFSLVIATDGPQWKSPDRMEGTDEENKLAARGTLAYYGTYSVNDNDHALLHGEKLASEPERNYSETELALNGDELKYSTPPFRYPKGTITGYFVWKRVP